MGEDPGKGKGEFLYVCGMVADSDGETLQFQ